VHFSGNGIGSSFREGPVGQEGGASARMAEPVPCAAGGRGSMPQVSGASRGPDPGASKSLTAGRCYQGICPYSRSTLPMMVTNMPTPRCTTRTYSSLTPRNESFIAEPWARSAMPIAARDLLAKRPGCPLLSWGMATILLSVLRPQHGPLESPVTQDFDRGVLARLLPFFIWPLFL
jgi:hypothetical protein